MLVYYSDEYVCSEYAFETTRKAKLVADRIKSDAPTVEVVPPSISFEETARLLGSIHDAEYIHAVLSGSPRHLAESQGFAWDPKSPRMYVAHNAGCVSAVDQVLANGGVSGTLSSGLHHARSDGGVGFCTFNGVALAAHRAIDQGAQNVLIVDFDAHGGGGTYSIISNMPQNVVHLDLVVSPFDLYRVVNDRDILDVVDERLYDSSVSHMLEQAQKKHDETNFDIMIYNAGMDPVNDGISASSLSRREELVASFIQNNNIPSIFTLAGGYKWGGFTMDDIASFHMMTVEAFAKVESQSEKTAA